MAVTQGFLVLQTNGEFDVYSVGQFPKGTVVGRDALRFRVVGESWVQPPKTHLTGAELEQWRRQLEEAGHSVTVGPFWTDPDMLERSLAEIARGETVPLREAFDEIRRRADERSRSEDRRLESVEPPAI
jgi:hypothetical protein